MPLYKFVGNKILSRFQNRMLGVVAQRVPFRLPRLFGGGARRRFRSPLNTNDFHFDTEIIIQLMLAGLRITELPIPTYYGDEICRVNGMKYAWDVTKAVLVARSQQLGLFYDRRFDCAPAAAANAHYSRSSTILSPHSVGARAHPERGPRARSRLCRRLRRRRRSAASAAAA